MDYSRNLESTVSGDINMQGENVAGRDINYININEEDTTIRCPNTKCGIEPDVIPESGEIKCTNCGEVYYEWLPSTGTVTNFKNVPPDLSRKYGDLIFQITTSIRLSEFKIAQKKCREAIDVSSRTSQGWEYLAFSYYLGTKKEDIIRNKADKIIKYLKVAEGIDSSSPTLARIRKTLSYKLYHVLRHRIEFNREGNLKDSLKPKIMSHYISSWQVCYRIFPSPFFLKEIIRHYYGGMRENWYDYEFRDAKGEFELVNLFESWKDLNQTIDVIIDIVKKQENKYLPPKIKGGDFNGLLKLNLDQLLEHRRKERKLREAELLAIKVEEERLEEERLEEERLEEERLEEERLEEERLEKEEYLENHRIAQTIIFKNERLEKDRIEREIFDKEEIEKAKRAKLKHIELVENEKRKKDNLNNALIVISTLIALVVGVWIVYYNWQICLFIALVISWMMSD